MPPPPLLLLLAEVVARSSLGGEKQELVAADLDSEVGGLWKHRVRVQEAEAEAEEGADLRIWDLMQGAKTRVWSTVAFKEVDDGFLHFLTLCLERKSEVLTFRKYAPAWWRALPCYFRHFVLQKGSHALLLPHLPIA